MTAEDRNGVPVTLSEAKLALKTWRGKIDPYAELLFETVIRKVDKLRKKLKRKRAERDVAQLVTEVREWLEGDTVPGREKENLETAEDLLEKVADELEEADWREADARATVESIQRMAAALKSRGARRADGFNLLTETIEAIALTLPCPNTLGGQSTGVRCSDELGCLRCKLELSVKAARVVYNGNFAPTGAPKERRRPGP